MSRALAVIDWRDSIDRAKSGAPTKTMSNLMQFMRHLPGAGKRMRYNELTGLIEFNGRMLRDEDYVDIRMMIEAEGLTPSENDVIKAVARHAITNAYHPIRDYLDGLKWDGTERLDHWLQDTFGAADTILTRAFGRKFLTAAAKRIYEPGCKFDYMLVLEGGQGIGKTKAVIELFGAEYTTSDLHTFSGKEAAESIQGMWAAEIGELSALSRTDVRDSKKFISNTIDRYRPSYGRNLVHFPRVTVFIGTTNDEEYLNDPSGGRRYWPVPCQYAQSLTSVRDQLWAEAVASYRKGERIWLDHDELITEAKSEQEKRFAQDVWATAIDKYLADPEVKYRGGTTVVDVMLNALKIETPRMTKSDQMRVAAYLRSKKMVRVQRRRTEGGNQEWGWDFT
jgi:putative DNA primase/helicase